MKKILAILNTLAILGMIAVNGAAGAGGINGNTVGSISNKYDTLFAPAGYAFSIWSIIYLGLIAFAGFQLIRAFKNDKDSGFIFQIGPWMIVNSVANTLWIFAWLNEYIGVSLILMLVILTSLLVMIIRLDMRRWEAPFPIRALVWWPIGIYSGWIAVATIANVAAYFVSIEWLSLFSAVNWTAIMLVVAIVLNLLILFFRDMREFAAVGIWALLAIAIRQWDVIPLIQWTALSGVVILSVAILFHVYRKGITNPGI